MATFERSEAIYALGKEVVELAENAVRVGTGKDLWRLSDEERRSYLVMAMAACGCTTEYSQEAMARIDSLVKNRDR